MSSRRGKASSRIETDRGRPFLHRLFVVQNEFVEVFVTNLIRPFCYTTDIQFASQLKFRPPKIEAALGFPGPHVAIPVEMPDTDVGIWQGPRLEHRGTIPNPVWHRDDLEFPCNEVQGSLKENGTASAAAIDQLGSSMVQVASSGAAGQAQVDGLTQAYYAGGISAQQFQAALDVLIARHAAHAAVASEDTAATQNLTGNLGLIPCPRVRYACHRRRCGVETCLAL